MPSSLIHHPSSPSYYRYKHLIDSPGRSTTSEILWKVEHTLRIELVLELFEAFRVRRVVALVGLRRSVRAINIVHCSAMHSVSTIT